MSKFFKIVSLALTFIMLSTLALGIVVSADTEAVTPTIGARYEFNASTGDLFLGGNYIEIGISKHGSFGTIAAATNPSFHHLSTQFDGIGLTADKDGWDVGNDPVTGDFFIPGSPEECYIVAYKIDDVEYNYTIRDLSDWDDGYSKDFTSWIQEPTVSNASEGNTLRAIVAGITPENVKYTFTYQFDVNDKFFTTDVTYENLGSAKLDSVRFVRSFDPDQDRDFYDDDSYVTYNKVICNPVSENPAGIDNFALVVARGCHTLEGFFFASFDNRARCSATDDDDYFAPYSAYMNQLWVDNPSIPTCATEESIALTDPNSDMNGYIYEDNAIAITFDFGTVDAGGSVSTKMYSSLDGNVYESLNNVVTQYEEETAPEQGDVTLDTVVEDGAPITDVALKDTVQDFIDSGLFDEEELTKINGGEDAKIWLNVKPVDMSKISETDQNTVKDEAKKLAGDDAVITYFEVNLKKQVGSDAEIDIPETSNLVNVELTVPDELINHDKSIVRDFKIIRLFNGKVDVLDGSFNPETKVLSFSTDKFSTYALVYSDKPANAPAASTEPVSPRTGDFIVLEAIALVLALSFGTAALVEIKKRKAK